MLAHVGIATIQPEKFGPLFRTNWSYVRVQIKRDSENPLYADKIKGIVHPDQDIITGASWSQALGRGLNERCLVGPLLILEPSQA